MEAISKYVERIGFSCPCDLSIIRLEFRWSRQVQRKRQEQKNTRAKMADVAKLAGVSNTTVSRVLRNPEMVSQDVRERVAAAMERLSYVPNFFAGGLSATQSRIIGLIIPSVRNTAFAVMVEEVTELLSRQGYYTLIGHSNYSSTEEERIVVNFLSWSPAGVILVGNQHSRPTITSLLTANIPVIETWERDASIDCAVGFSHREVGEKVARYFFGIGCRKVAVVGSAADIDPRAGKRTSAFRQAALELRMTGVLDVTANGRASPEGGAEGLSEVLRLQPDTEAVFFSNDALALGGLFECQRRGIRVPGDLKLCGFGDLPFSSQSVPTISTIRPPRAEIAAKAVEMLLTLIRGEEPVSRKIDVGFELVVRGSG
ncbi:LacI family DNA-binding transcriptional regulator [Neorhizobium tomejilense]|uniref:LacI family DNA-binding transcriptional regulator n=1 Tax=Neorhizobium tomejilense TaxID=2093828 RepID=UPI003ECE2A16